MRTPAISGVVKAVGDLELGIEREQQRQAQRPARIQILLLAGVPPGTAQSFVAETDIAHRHGRRVVQKLTEGILAKALVLTGVQNKFVPQGIDHLRGHRNKLPLSLQICQKKLPQSLRHQLAVLGGQGHMLLAQFGEQAAR